eukprot:m51a1_g9216 putative 3 -cyclic-nucleotide phosphodiesterase rega (808) ;mRNA; f:50535-53703
MRWSTSAVLAMAAALAVRAGELAVLESTVLRTAGIVDQIYSAIEHAAVLGARQAEQVARAPQLPDAHLDSLSFVTGAYPQLADQTPNRTTDFWVSCDALETDPVPLLTEPYERFGSPRCWCKSEWEALCNKTEAARAGRPCVSCERACETLWGMRVSSVLDPYFQSVIPDHPFTLGWLWARGGPQLHQDWARVWAVMPYSVQTGVYSFSGISAESIPWSTDTKGGFPTKFVEDVRLNRVFDRRPVWSLPYWLAARQSIVVSVGVPIWSKHGEYLGSIFADIPMTASKAFFLNLSFISPVPFRSVLAYSSGDVIAASDEAIEQLWGSCDNHLCNVSALSPRMDDISAQAPQRASEYWDVTIRGAHYIVMHQSLQLGWKLWFFVRYSDAFPKVVALSSAFLVVVVVVHRRMQKHVRELERQLGAMATSGVMGTPAEDAIQSLVKVQRCGRLPAALRDEVSTVMALIATNKLYKADSNLREKLQELKSWDYDVNEICGAQEHMRLELVAMAALEGHSLISYFNLDRNKVRKFFRAVEKGYKENPYHNATHAADVVQSMHALLMGCTGFCFTPLEKLAALIAAACHDYGHWGVNNTFLQATMDALYVQYNGVSVLESMHSAESMRLMLGLGSGRSSTKEDREREGGGGQERGSFVRGKLTREDTYELHRSVAQLILATDMARHLELTSLFATRTTAGKMDPASKADRLLVLQMLIKASDVSNPARPWPACHRWARRVMDEFFAQGDAERALGLRVSPFMDRATADTPKCQLALIKFVVRPMMELILPLCPSVAQSMLTNLAVNLHNWEMSK